MLPPRHELELDPTSRVRASARDASGGGSGATLRNPSLRDRGWAMKRTHSDLSRVQAAYSGDTSNRRAIDYILRQLADGPDGATPGPEELLEALESHPGA